MKFGMRRGITVVSDYLLYMGLLIIMLSSFTIALMYAGSFNDKDLVLYNDIKYILDVLYYYASDNNTYMIKYEAKSTKYFQGIVIKFDTTNDEIIIYDELIEVNIDDLYILLENYINNNYNEYYVIEKICNGIECSIVIDLVNIDIIPTTTSENYVIVASNATVISFIRDMGNSGNIGVIVNTG